MLCIYFKFRVLYVIKYEVSYDNNSDSWVCVSLSSLYMGNSTDIRFMNELIIFFSPILFNTVSLHTLTKATIIP